MIESQNSGRSFAPAFSLAQRADDLQIIQRLKEFFGGAGYMEYRKYQLPTKPQWRLVIKGRRAVQPLLRHFDQYPLQGKKRRDYDIWKEYVQNPHTPKEWQREMKARLSQIKTFEAHVEEPAVQDAQLLLDRLARP